MVDFPGWTILRRAGHAHDPAEGFRKFVQTRLGPAGYVKYFVGQRRFCGKNVRSRHVLDEHKIHRLRHRLRG